MYLLSVMLLFNVAACGLPLDPVAVSEFAAGLMHGCLRAATAPKFRLSTRLTRGLFATVVVVVSRTGKGPWTEFDLLLLILAAENLLLVLFVWLVDLFRSEFFLSSPVSVCGKASILGDIPCFDFCTVILLSSVETRFEVKDDFWLADSWSSSFLSLPFAVDNCAEAGRATGVKAHFFGCKLNNFDLKLACFAFCCFSSSSKSIDFILRNCDGRGARPLI